MYTNYFSSDGVTIAYLDQGEGDPVLLVHGFASTARVNWINPGWVDLLCRDGRRIIALDNRGHGDSQKLYDPVAYNAPAMVEDARRLLDHLGIKRADVMGYSMGARIVTFLTILHSDRVRRIILGGVGSNLFEGTKGTNDIIAALESPDLASVMTPVGRAFRKFADANKSDLRALAACMRSSRMPVRREDLKLIHHPVMVAVGTKDDIAGLVEPLVDCFSTVYHLEICNRDHMRAVGDKSFQQGVLDFLNRSYRDDKLI